ncbi:MAG: DNA polymerase I [Spirochaetaceae bacterium]|nr:DNA polymerase I [Spirochaetaceae bacterium]
MAARPGREKRLYLIDGMPLVYRAYFVFLNNPLITANGFNSSAVFGYTTSLLQILTDEQPTHIAVVFDAPGPTWRTQEYADYKGTRAKAPEGVRDSLPHVHRVTEAMGIPIISHAGVEADDVIGTVARRAEAAGFDTYMVTLDKDFAQLVSEHTFLYRLPRMGGDPPLIYDVAGVRERFGVARPEQVIDLIGLAGDSVDNIPGIPGVGEKTAQKLIDRFGSVEELVAGTDQLKGKQREKIETFAEQALLSKRLATIEREVEVEVDPDDLGTPKLDPERVIPVFQEFEFNALIKRIFGDAAAAAAATPGAAGADGGELRSLDDREHDYVLVEDETARAGLCADLLQCASVSVFVVAGPGDAKTCRLAGVALSGREGSAAYLPLPQERAAAAAVLAELAPFWEHDGIAKVGHDLKRWVTALRWHGVTVAGRHLDTRLAHQLVESDGAHDLALLCEHYLGYQLLTLDEVADDLLRRGDFSAATLADGGLPPATLAAWAGERADLTASLLDALQAEIDRCEERELWERVEVPLMPLLVEMEYAGVGVRVDTLREYSGELEKEVVAHELELYRLADGAFNLNSPKQLGELLFEKLRISDKPKRTRTGQYMTTEQELTRLADRHPIIPLILEYRAVQKLKSTYVDTLPGAVMPQTGRIHTTFNQLVAATGRLNSEGPNLQNIPIRSDRGREIRRAFVAPEGQVLLAADYSQIELRIMAAITEDPGLVEAFAGDVDIHAATSARVFGVPLDGVTADMRRRAKMINFGLMYGMSAFGLAQRLNIARAEARAIIERYFEQFPNIKQYMGDTVAGAREHGYVETMRGRRRYLRDINSRNHAARAASERIAINAPIQGSAADMIKIAMLDIDRELRGNRLAARMILQVHDELVFEVPHGELEQVQELVVRGMRDALPLGRVPVVVEVGTGHDWLEAH